MRTRLSDLLSIQYPVIQAGMVWCTNANLVSAVSNAGGLGTLGAGSMYPNELREEIGKILQKTYQPFAVNLPLLYPQINEHIDTILELKVPIVITSAGNPSTYTSLLKKEGVKVLHVVSNTRFAINAQDAGVDAIIGEGFEAGGHNGREETTTMCLIPQLKKILQVPLVAAGGIASGHAMAAAMALGADGVQIGSRFVNSSESPAHQHFKEAIIQAKEGDTRLTLKEITPVRLLQNPFYQEVVKAYELGASKEELLSLLGKGRAKKGMRLGDLESGELEIGQVSAMIDDILPAGDILRSILQDCKATISQLNSLIE